MFCRFLIGHYQCCFALTGGSLTKLAYYSTVQHKVAKVRSFDHTTKVNMPIEPAAVSLHFLSGNILPPTAVGQRCNLSPHCLRRRPVTSSMKYLCKKRSLHGCTLSSSKMLTLKHAWTSSKTILSTRKPKSSKPQVEGRTSSRNSLRGNSDSSEY